MREGWKEVRLKKACDLFTDGDWIETKNQSSNGIRLIQTGNIGSGKFKNRKKKARFISEETFEELNCTEVLPGDLLVSRLPDPVGRSCIIPDIDSKMITAVDCTIIRLELLQKSGQSVKRLMRLGCDLSFARPAPGSDNPGPSAAVFCCTISQ